MLGNKYTFTEHSQCCISRQRPKCPGICGYYSQSIHWFNISSDGTNLNESHNILLNVISGISGSNNLMNYNRSIPFFCCQYISSCSCDQAQIILHNKYKIVSPYYGCGNKYTITNNGAQIGQIEKAGCCCCKHFNIFNQNGDLVQTVGKSENLLDNIIGYDLIGVNNEGVKVSGYNVYHPFCCGNIEVTAEVLAENQNEKCLSLALVPYL